jgi:hypothetical protein
MAQIRTLVYARTMSEAATARWKALEAMREGSEILGVSYLEALTCCAFANVARLARNDLTAWQRRKMEGAA